MNLLVTALLCVVPGDTTPSPDELNKAVEELRKNESKLRSMYQEIISGYKKTAPIHSQIKDLNNDIETLNAKLLSISGQGKGVNGRAAEANAKNSLRNRIKDLTNQKTKLEKDLKTKLEPVKQQEEDFKDEAKKLWQATNKSLVPILKGMKIGGDRKAFDSVVSAFDLFIFDDHREVVALKGESPIDQESVSAAGSCLATVDISMLPTIRKSFDKNAAFKYASVKAVTEMGSVVGRSDKDFASLLNELKAQLIKNTALPRPERDARQRLVEKALEAIK
ncbi:MAG TPA: hypothetical protein VKD71_05000 [Gemmataceae bacterium]|nr:hypothetical protein [Gemmataceae bacterium]